MKKDLGGLYICLVLKLLKSLFGESLSSKALILAKKSDLTPNITSLFYCVGNLIIKPLIVELEMVNNYWSLVKNTEIWQQNWGTKYRNLSKTMLESDDILLLGNRSFLSIQIADFYFTVEKFEKH